VEHGAEASPVFRRRGRREEHYRRRRAEASYGAAFAEPSDARAGDRGSSCETISLQDLVGETFIGMADQAPVLRSIIEDYNRRSGLDLEPTHRGEYLSMAMSLIASTRGVALLPGFARNFLTWSVTSRPLEGEAPWIDLVLGYHKANNSPLLRTFLSRVDEMVRHVSKRSGKREGAAAP
jgi:LysR family transcriptional regulator, hca operon transcriptional activator